MRVAKGSRKRHIHPRLVVASIFLAILGFAMVGVYAQSTANAASQNSTNLSAGTCGLTSQALTLASQVAQAPKFIKAENGLSYALEYAYSQGPETGVANAVIVSSGQHAEANGTGPASSAMVGGTQVYYPPSMVLVFFSYGGASATYCADDPLRDTGVVGVISASVPQNGDGSFNLSGMSIDFTPGLSVNGTAVQR